MKKFLFLIVLINFSLQAQVIRVYETVSDTRHPELTWQSIQPVDTVEFQIFRASVRDKQFKEIHPLHYTEPVENTDTLLFRVVDTVPAKKGIYLYYIQVFRNGKPQKSATAMAHNLGVLPKPQIIAFKAEPLTDRKAVRLRWKLNYDESVSSISLYRSRSYDGDYEKIADLGPQETEYIDIVPLANEPWFYFMELNNYFGGKSLSVRTPAFATFKEKPFPPQDLTVEQAGDSIVLQWRNVGNNIVGFRVYRSIGKQPFMLMHDMIPSGGKRYIRFVDTTREARSAVELRYYVRNVSDGFVESNITDTVRLYLPAREAVYPPAQTDYVLLPGGKIKLLWVPDERGIITGYRVYEVKNGKSEPLSKDLISTNYFTVEHPGNGLHIYEIEGVGIEGKTSEKRARISIHILPSEPEVLLNLQKQNEGIKITWHTPAGRNIRRLILYRQTGNDAPVRLKTFAPGEDVYLDKQVKRGKVYMYFMQAEMKDGSKRDLNNAVEMRWE